MLECYPDLMTVKHVQSALSIGRSKAYDLIHSGALHYIQVGRQIRIPKKYLVDYLARLGYNRAQESDAGCVERGAIWTTVCK